MWSGLPVVPHPHRHKLAVSATLSFACYSLRLCEAKSLTSLKVQKAKGADPGEKRHNNSEPPLGMAIRSSPQFPPAPTEQAARVPGHSAGSPSCTRDYSRAPSGQCSHIVSDWPSRTVSSGTLQTAQAAERLASS